MLTLPEGIAQTFDQILRVMGAWWWVVLPIALAFIVKELWEEYAAKKYVAGLEWVLLQFVIPQEIVKTPLAMEQIFASLHSVLGQGIKGKIQDWFSFEIRSAGGAVYFYVYTPAKHRDLVESSIYAQYPETEIFEAPDYTGEIPSDIPNEEYDIFGAEFILEKKDAYPIRSYQAFRFDVEESKRFANVDPLAGVIEALSHLREGEHFWLQLRIEPTDDGWKKEGEDVIKELMGEKKEDAKSFAVVRIIASEIAEFLVALAKAPFTDIGAGGKAEKEEKKERPQLSPGKQNALEAVENSLTKVGFKSTIRGLYIARRDVFDKSRFGSVTGMFKQFSIQDLNGIKLNKDTATKTDGPFKEYRERRKKRELLAKYQKRGRPAEAFVFNVEELATVYHFPSRVITAPTISRVESRRGEPPSSLPTFP